MQSCVLFVSVCKWLGAFCFLLAVFGCKCFECFVCLVSPPGTHTVCRGRSCAVVAPLISAGWHTDHDTRLLDLHPLVLAHGNDTFVLGHTLPAHGRHELLRHELLRHELLRHEVAALGCTQSRLLPVLLLLVGPSWPRAQGSVGRGAQGK